MVNPEVLVYSKVGLELIGYSSVIELLIIITVVTAYCSYEYNNIFIFVIKLMLEYYTYLT